MTSQTVISFNDAAEKSAYLFNTAPATLLHDIGFAQALRLFILCTALGDHDTGAIIVFSYVMGLPLEDLEQWTGWTDEVRDGGYVFDTPGKTPSPLEQLGLLHLCQAQYRP